MVASPLLPALAPLTREPGRPRLTWYGPDSERIELSGAVLANWMNKCANMAVEELDAAPGARVGLDLPVHWRAVVWALGTWCTGAELTLTAPGTDPSAPAPTTPDVVLTHRPHDWAASGALIAAVALPGLARRWDGAPLPAGAIDSAAAVMSFGDQIGYLPPTDPDAPALGDVPYAELLGWASQALPGSRTLLTVDDDGPDALAATLRACLGAWAADASVVLCGTAHSARLREDPALLARLVTQEQVG